MAAGALAACGGGEPTTAHTSSPRSEEERIGTAPSSNGAEDRSSTSGDGRPSAAPKRHIAVFGTAGTQTQIRAAQGPLVAYLAAYEAGNWAIACDHLVADVRAEIEAVAAQLPQMQGSGCAAALPVFLRQFLPKGKQEYETKRLSGLRYKREAGYAIFIGADGIEYWMPMRVEGGEWKVIAVTPTAIHES
jgi:hypothetical protein